MTVNNSPNGPAYIQANTVNAAVLRQVQASIVPVAGIVGAADLLVTANGTPNMTVNVASGFAFVAGSQSVPAQGTYHVYNDASVSLSISAANATNPRRDLICLSIQDAAYSGAANQALLQVVTGTPAASPADPATPANSIVLARVAVAANATSITSGNITDLRTGSTVNRAPLGVLGYASVTTSQSGIGAQTDITGLTTTVTVGANRRIRIKAYCFAFTGGTFTDTYNLYLMEGATQLQVFGISAPGTAGVGGGPEVILIAPSAGSHTYKVQASHVSGAATGTFNAGPTDPGFIVVEDLGSTL